MSAANTRTPVEVMGADGAGLSSFRHSPAIVKALDAYALKQRSSLQCVGSTVPEIMVTAGGTKDCSLLESLTLIDTTDGAFGIRLPTVGATDGMQKTFVMVDGVAIATIEPTVNPNAISVALTAAGDNAVFMFYSIGTSGWVLVSSNPAAGGGGGGVLSGTEYTADFDSNPSFIRQTDLLNVPTGIDFNLTAMSSTGGEGANLNIAAGSSTWVGGGAGGVLNMNAGGSSTGNGGAVNITGGFAGNTGTNAGGGVSILAGSSTFAGTTGDGGASSLRAGSSIGGIGGVATLRAGNSDNSDGGAVFIQSGSSLVSGYGGDINVFAGNTQAGGGVGGNVDMYGGYAIVDGQGGDVNMFGGESTSGGRGGHATMRAGASFDAIGEAANATVRGGNVSSPDTTTSGHVLLVPGFNGSVPAAIQPGTSGHRLSGSVVINATTASAAAGAHLVAIQSLLPFPDSGTVSARSSDMAGSWTGAAVASVAIGFIVAYAHAPHVVVSATHGAGGFSFLTHSVTATGFTVTSSLADITALTWIGVGGSIA